MDDLISVIMPVYNREKYLHECILSIINQTYKNLEIIFIDDGSTDNSLSILKSYERLDNRIKVLTQKNMGICMAIKNAFSISKGKYIFRMDSDDVNSLYRCEKQYKFLIENDYDVVGCYLKSFGDGNELSKKGMEQFVNKPIRNLHDQNRRIYEGSNIGGGYFFGKSDVLKKLSPFHKDYGLVEDVYMYILLNQNGYKIGMLEEELYYYRVHSSNTSISTNRKQVVDKYFEVIFRFLFKDLINKYENIVIFKRYKEMELIKKCFKNYYSHRDNIFYFDETNLYEYEKYKFDPKNTLVLLGATFSNILGDYFINKNYIPYKNIFSLVDCGGF